MQNSLRYLETVAMPVQPIHHTPQLTFNPLSGYLVLSLPIAFSIAVCIYLQWRSYLHDQHVKMLERIWQKDWNIPQGGSSEGYSNPL